MSATSDVNFIHHFLNVFQAFYKDRLLRPTHLCLYTALFIHWNKARWENPFDIFRPKIMKLSKIGSLNTYYRCMKDLNEWGYIDYFPSSSQSVPSMVVLHRYDKVTSIDSAVKSDTGPGKLPVKSDSAPDEPTVKSESAGGIAPVPEVIPYSINSISDVSNVSSVNGTTAHTQNHTGQEDVENLSTPQAVTKKKAGAGVGRGKPESLEEVTAFFLSINSNESEAAHFFHHYNAVDWVKGNNLPVKNWHSTAEAWLRNSPRFKSSQPGGPTPGSLQTPGTPGVTKNYDIKL
ncbi:hypothetical protein KK062_06935 [Fulvivirgaceae bacterium PWU5]|uniref:Uncharacterized protein n=1 Tax=Dawidia cretensis TaxID=2782350 RepID=A0AAP2DV09_9BACT|nr:hypothetical protein [Dawidia cretensis]MBT1707948.1 hypothetical protein [Dawidia cretensis]